MLRLIPFLVVLIASTTVGCTKSSDKTEALKGGTSNSSSKLESASQEDIYLYRGIGMSNFCNARDEGVEFEKAIRISAKTYAQVLSGHHGGVVDSAGKKKLTNEQLFNGAAEQIIIGAIKFCPKNIPTDVKDKVQEAVEKKQS